MKKQTIEIDFIEFDDIQLGDVFTIKEGTLNSFCDYEVTRIDEDKIVLFKKQSWSYKWIKKQAFQDYLDLMVEDEFDYYEVVSIHRTYTIWQSVKNQCGWKLDRDN